MGYDSLQAWTYLRVNAFRTNFQALVPHHHKFMLLSQNLGGRSATMRWSLFVNLTGYKHGAIVLGLGLLIAGFIVHLLAAFVG